MHIEQSILNKVNEWLTPTFDEPSLIISKVYFNFLLGFSDLDIHVLKPLFNNPIIDPELGQCDIYNVFLPKVSTKNLLYLF